MDEYEILLDEELKAEEKVFILQQMGYDIEEIFEMVLRVSG